MTSPIRITRPLLDVLEVFFRACKEDTELHGWAIMRATKRSGPTVYGVLDRLEDMGWIDGRWEEQGTESNRPRRRFYRITPTGAVGAREILRQRRPQALYSPGLPAPGQAAPGWRHALGQGGAV
jgi:PadR family transcriptional regulator